MPDASTTTRTRYQRIYELARLIPAGQIATYGQLAKLAGSTARQAGYAMAALPAGSDVPWHRVINAQGMISERRGGGGQARQHRMLRAEGIDFDRQGRVDLATVRWPGPGWAWLAAHGYNPEDA